MLPSAQCKHEDGTGGGQGGCPLAMTHAAVATTRSSGLTRRGIGTGRIKLAGEGE
eukprot:CAMPEP_0117668038 /NCGR_PEP_ID=MMETSP0804-20121206/11308_1 /TAXON_ID=1074897 /ORGANISM="Tetraselmis astigmatica, Strain CCMP880" /LENGTH=54 /DNA_ID=CAMNT_0005475847 /DNA_START=97 /DNA_END=258 /DNA_ORIENTATION=-